MLRKALPACLLLAFTLLLSPTVCAAKTIVVPAPGPGPGSDVDGTSSADDITMQTGAFAHDINGLGGDDSIVNQGTTANSINGGTGTNTISNQAGGVVTKDISGGLGSSGNRIDNAGTVTDTIIGSENWGDGETGGSNTITNSGTTDYIVATDNEGANTVGGGNNVNNSGTVTWDLFGDYNWGTGSKGGNNTLVNTGDVQGDMLGSYNQGDNSSAYGNVIRNSGTVTGIWGSSNGGDGTGIGTSGGNHTITNTGTVFGGILGSDNIGDNAQGGGNTITSTHEIYSAIYGTLNWGTGSSGGSNTLNNSGSIFGGAWDMVGTYNWGVGTSGGGNTVTNSGTVWGALYGSENFGAGASGGSNTVTNSGQTLGMVGSDNFDDKAEGGSNTVTNSGEVDADVIGSWNSGTISANGGGNTVTNSGTVGQDVIGSLNDGANSSGGGNTVSNSGSVGRDLIGSANEGANSSGGGNTVINSGTVTGDVYGSNNLGAGSSSTGNTIYNSGSVGGGIYAGSGNDLVVIQTGSQVTGKVDGQAGTDALRFEGAGTQASTEYLNFECVGFAGSGSSTLTGNWVCTMGTTASGGTINLNGTFSTPSLTVTGGTVNINNTTTVGGPTTVTGGTLNVISADTLTTTSLTNSGTTNISGTMAVSGATTNSGTLGVTGTLTTASLTNSGTANLGGTTTVSGATTNSGTLNMTGTLNTGSLTNSGAATIGGTVNANSADNSGYLAVNGKLNSALTNTGTLGGSGTVNGTVTNSGTVSPGNSIGTLTVNGNYTHAPTAAYSCELAAGGSSDLLHVTGKAVLNGGKLSLVLPAALYSGGETWTVITADGGLAGAFAEVGPATPTAMIRFSLSYGATGLVTTLNRNSFTSVGTTPGQKAVGRGLDGLVTRAAARGDSMARLLTTMDWTYDASQIQAALTAMSPEMYDGFSWASLNSARRFGDILGDRTDWLRVAAALDAPRGAEAQGPVNAAAEETGSPALAAGSGAGVWSMWARALGSWDRRDASDGYLGNRANSGGAAVGADGQLFPWLRLGFAFGAERGDLSWSQGGHSGDQSIVHSGVYASADWGGAHLDASLSYSAIDNSAKRQVCFTDADSETNANFDGGAWLARLGGGYDLRAGGWLVGPLASLDYLSLSEDSLHESGADYLNLSVANRDCDYWSTRLGLRAGARWDLGSLVLLPRLELGWRHLLNDDGRDLTASFQGYSDAPFGFTGLQPAADVFEVSAGVSAALAEEISAFLQYGGAWGDGCESQGVSAGLTIFF